MTCRCPLAPTRALFDALIAPAHRQVIHFAPRSLFLKAQRQTRHVSRYSPHETAKRDVTPFNDPQRPLDQAIRATRVNLVDPKTGGMQPNVPLRDVLRRLESDEHARQVALGKDGTPVVKIVTANELREERDLRAMAARQKPADQTKKEMELSWGIDRANDLGYRLRQIEGWLAGGRDVDIMIAAKKGGRRTERAECEALVADLRSAAERVPGASFAKLDGALGGHVVLQLKGATESQGASNTSREVLRQQRNEKRAEKEKAKAEWKAELEARAQRRAERQAQTLRGSIASDTGS